MSNIFSGKMSRVLVEQDGKNSVMIWADESDFHFIQETEGVSCVSADNTHKNKYFVSIDPRYDANAVILNITKKIIFGN